MKLALLSTALCISGPAIACQTASKDITQQTLAERIDYACKCEQAAMALLAPPLFRSAFLRGLASKYLDNHPIQEALDNMNSVEKNDHCMMAGN